MKRVRGSGFRVQGAGVRSWRSRRDRWLSGGACPALCECHSSVVCFTCDALRRVFHRAFTVLRLFVVNAGQARPLRERPHGHFLPPSPFRLPPFLLCLLLPLGCGKGIDTGYGQRSGTDAALSVNGTAVLAGMFERAGHRVYSRHALSPGLGQRADCIVWFPDDFQPPPEPVREWLEKWLAEQFA